MKQIELFDISISDSLKNNFLKEFNNLEKNKDWIGGESVIKFEENFKKFIGSKYCIALNSGTDALELALISNNIKPGDKVIVPAFSFFATSEAVLKIGAKPIYCDISKNDLNIDINSLDKRMDKSVKAIIPVHLFGNPANMLEINKFANEHNLIVIEDVAQAFGSKIDNTFLGNMGNIGCFSFYPTKNLGGFGDGGCVVTNNKSVAMRINYLRNHGQTKKYYHKFVGYNSRLDNIQAIILNLKLKDIDKVISKKSSISKLYVNLFEKNEDIFVHTAGKQPLNLFPISFKTNKQLKKIKEVLDKNNIQYGGYYPYGLHEFPISNHDGRKLNITDWATKNILTLPIHPKINKQDVEFITKVINNSLQTV